MCKITSIEKEDKIKVEANILGIVFPVYYARLPLIVEQLVRKLEINEDTYVFAVVTYGGAPAEVLVKLRNILQNNGGTLNSGFLIRMPANHIFAYNPSSEKRLAKVFQREKAKVKKISDIIRNREDHECELSKLVIDTIIDRFFIKTTDKIIENFQYCPKQAIQWGNKTVKRRRYRNPNVRINELI